ncbi:hypothetical protein COLO4_10965 [Corchorus olitorius]|uniref:Uncharacterized protein n=1 Tax=Corchorus olitorius TaxID=93759 RepID=A0A1R3K6I6_9ROSI|nr:hypothetical protein COLO4_10965 [Corchorus olitorius]
MGECVEFPFWRELVSFKNESLCLLFLVSILRECRERGVKAWPRDQDGAPPAELSLVPDEVDDAELAGKSSQLDITCLVGTLVACPEPIKGCHIEY